MGSWQLEVAKMALYVSFPVGMFHWFNHQTSFESISKQFRDKYQVENVEGVKIIERAKEDRMRAMFEKRKKLEM